MTVSNNATLYPGNTLGIIGDSSNGSQLITAARRLGLRVIAYGPNEVSETMQLADVHIVGAMNDGDKLQEFGEKCDSVIYESEHVDAQTIKYLEQYTKIPQGTNGLEVTQDRLIERAFFDQLNLNSTPYATIISLSDIYESINSIGYPSILKPIQKSLTSDAELRINTQTDIPQAADLLNERTYILESTVDAKQELVITVAQGMNGERKIFPIAENVYAEEHLVETIMPATTSDAVQNELLRITNQIADSLAYVGVFEISFAITNSEDIYVKRIVPSIHRPGYVFNRATNVSVFDQHLRAIAGMPLSDIKLFVPTIMVNFDKDQMEAIRTQWNIKNNWYFHVYAQNKTTEKATRAGYVLVEANSVQQAQEQIDDTEIWRKTVIDFSKAEQ
ncbi:Phosphoribosylaminoimidazole carboxylase ATPase subunit [Pediococcus damnosus]|uniref:Phosphoribosylaminoimidazole carboxylase ATPase subunit n=1 Tax=Pediococcus damnosus TaxID=51663 RepID=A0A0R2HGT1_9LACO|nr:ATP-grasp domain-containing protein [Pediococcus damnosus]AMV61794.1 Phosphoribosylaminoimidazole carboxylase ATPase subunit [Pediococcus damnosus]AMV66331.1 Phosphoribosylaminoimidazole carboxylase ATPase subunit [Pediococcus damnosus]AMV68631.1 Phosphoribosylaminoimidazole carboxylase ATPase subunit [Pediococcus damnosus]KJU75090.1 phosphoribosylaminoimidazole carboxylase [Pediococcus damnosus LMG 28219]KRN52257.1 phosphoribosylaminoimidazole carboxylase, ATPase subunit [Pediococcus damno